MGSDAISPGPAILEGAWAAVGAFAGVWAVAGGANPGVYRSLDTGKTWSLIRAGNATDLTLAPASSAPILHATTSRPVMRVHLLA